MFGKFKKVKRRFRDVMSARYDKPLVLPTEKVEELVQELRAVFSQFSTSSLQDRPPSEEEWLQNVSRLRELVLNDNPREFLRWDIVLKTMSACNADYTRPELKYLKSLPDWKNRWSELLLKNLLLATPCRIGGIPIAAEL